MTGAGLIILLGLGGALLHGKKKVKSYYGLRRNGYELIDKDCQKGINVYDPVQAGKYNFKIGEELRNMGLDLGDPSKAEPVLIYLFNNLFLECVDRLPPPLQHLWNLYIPKYGEAYTWEELVKIMKEEMKRFGEGQEKSHKSNIFPGLF